MGRHSTGAALTYQCKCLELKNLLKHNLLQKDKKTTSTIAWQNGCKINVQAFWNGDQRYFLLEYTHTDSDGNKNVLSYQVKIVAMPSNLGKGEVLYMICPISGRYCKKLFMAYGCPYFKSIKAYQKRIYHSGQLSSKLDRLNDRYWHLSRKLENATCQRKQSKYDGMETKRSFRTKKMLQRLSVLDSQRWFIMPLKIRKMLPELGKEFGSYH